jgi:two-component system sensor histidine kinase KdpD
LIGTTRDITERKLAELERNRRLDAEREAAQLRDAFIGVVSHELRTPITTIFGGTRVLSRRWREMEPTARDALLGDVSGEADRLFRLVEDLLVLTSVERGSLDVGDDPVAIRPIVERVLASERARSPEVTFESAIPADLPSVRGEEMYVEQVLRNLLANAAKYSGPGSRVSVQAKVSASEVVLSVLDSGPGIPEAEGERIFELFYRSPSTAPTASGAGIGLFVCRQLARAMGGSIHAHNRPQGGAEFELQLRRYLNDDDGDESDDEDSDDSEGDSGV